jgi:hypothetical protein
MDPDNGEQYSAGQRPERRFPKDFDEFPNDFGVFASSIASLDEGERPGPALSNPGSAYVLIPISS